MTADELTRLIDRHAGPLVLYARQWTDAPEDVVQTALLKLVRLGRPPENPVPWLYTVVRNAARDAQRSARRRTKYETRRAEHAPNWFEDDTTGMDGETATAALADLPDDVREIVIAHLWGGSRSSRSPPPSAGRPAPPTAGTCPASPPSGPPSV